MNKLLAAAATIVVLGSAAGVANAGDPFLPGLTNGSFTAYTGSTPKGQFTSVQPTGWSSGGGLIYIDSSTIPGADAATGYLTTYADPLGSASGPGYNYVEADGNPIFEESFSYQLSGLTVGKTYTLNFYQGASSQTGFGYNSVVGHVSPTNNQWIVSLGTSGLNTCINCGSYDPLYGQTSTYSNPDGAADVVASPLMRVPPGAAVGWAFVHLHLTADNANDVLSFLAWGDKGSTVNLPPMAFLTGVDSPAGGGNPGVPEPATWAMMLLGVFGVGAMARRRSAKAASVTA